MRSLVKQNYLSELRSLDWDFDGANGSVGLAGYHWYPARFVPNVPGVLIGYFSQEYDVVLDPFCGSGTSLVEATRLGRSAIGIDTNPAATLISKSKLVAFREPEWQEFVDSMKNTYQDLFLKGTRSGWKDIPDRVPNFDENARWYHPETLHELQSLWESIQLQTCEYRAVAEAAFSAILRFVCSQNKHWGWICDNVWPKEFVYKAAAATYFHRLEQFAVSARTLRSPGRLRHTDADVRLGPCAAVLAEMPARSVDMVVTSPPYFGMTDYVRSQRLTFLWFDWNLDGHRATESGARYKRRRLSALVDYMDEMEASFREVARVLKFGGMCAIVIGESPNREAYLDNFEEMLEKLGFSVEATLTRNVSKRRVMTSQMHDERIILARRTEDSGS